jgi:hypothetical protein
MPESLYLERVAYLEMVTLGKIEHPKLARRIYTLERPWVPSAVGPGGTPSVSCVPDGRYTLVAHDSERHPNTYQLWNDSLGVYGDALPIGQAWGRTSILIHPGNVVADVIGCIAVGFELSFAQGVVQTFRSRDAMASLVALLGRKDIHELEIRPTEGTFQPST